MQTDFEEMAALTHGICEKGEDECSVFKDNPYRCCDVRYCEMAREFAASKGVDLQPTGNPDLLFMGDHGCTVPPHLRPTCTLHVCTISWSEKSHIEHDEDKTKAYFDLRERINASVRE